MHAFTDFECMLLGAKCARGDLILLKAGFDLRLMLEGSIYQVGVLDHRILFRADWTVSHQFLLHRLNDSGMLKTKIIIAWKINMNFTAAF